MSQNINYTSALSKKIIIIGEFLGTYGKVALLLCDVH